MVHVAFIFTTLPLSSISEGLTRLRGFYPLAGTGYEEKRGLRRGLSILFEVFLRVTPAAVRVKRLSAKLCRLRSVWMAHFHFLQEGQHPALLSRRCLRHRVKQRNTRTIQHFFPRKHASFH